MSPAYKESYLESKVLSASPVELVHMLYDHAVASLQEARAHLAAGDIAARTKSISKVLAVIGELEGSLDRQAGGELSQQLAALYTYMTERLSEGNFEQKDAPLAEVETLLRTLGEAWQKVTTQPTTTEANEMPAMQWGAQYAAPASDHVSHGWSA